MKIYGPFCKKKNFNQSNARYARSIYGESAVLPGENFSDKKLAVEMFSHQSEMGFAIKDTFDCSKP